MSGPIVPAAPAGITDLASADLPRVLADTNQFTGGTAMDVEGAVWRIDASPRQLDSNVIRLRAEGRIDAHAGPDLDVLLHVLQGSGQIITAAGPIAVAAGALVWLPRRSERAILAGPDGLIYLSVHQRRQGLSIASAEHLK